MANETPAPQDQAPRPATAEEYADDVLDKDFWPDPDQKSTTILRITVRQLLMMAYYAGQDSVIHKTIDDLHAVQWSRQ